MKPILAAILALILASISCGQRVEVATPTVAASLTPTSQPAPLSTLTAEPTKEAGRMTATVRQPVVLIHETAGGVALSDNWLEAGDVVTLLEPCGGDWCHVRTKDVTGWVWRGCLDSVAGARRCAEAK